MVFGSPWSEVKLRCVPDKHLELFLCSYAGGSQLEVKLVLLWKHNMRIEYLAVTPWPLDPSKRSTWVEVTMEGSYDILHDISCTMRKPITSLYRTTVIRRFWNTLQRWATPSSAAPRIWCNQEIPSLAFWGMGYAGGRPNPKSQRNVLWGRGITGWQVCHLAKEKTWAGLWPRLWGCFMVKVLVPRVLILWCKLQLLTAIRWRWWQLQYRLTAVFHGHIRSSTSCL